MITQLILFNFHFKGKLEETLGTFLGSIENVFTSTFTGSED